MVESYFIEEDGTVIIKEMPVGIVRQADGSYKDGDGNDFEVQEFEHSTFGLIKYIMVDSEGEAKPIPVEWENNDEDITGWESELDG